MKTTQSNPQLEHVAPLLAAIGGEQCAECVRLGWPTKGPLYGVEGRTVCWMHAGRPQPMPDPPAPAPTALAKCAAWHERQRVLNERSEAVAVEKNNMSDAGIYAGRAAMHARFALACREADGN